MQLTEATRMKTMGIEELAALLHRSVSTVATEVTKAPHKLPPRLRLPGSRRVLWLISDVEEWLRDHRDDRKLGSDKA